MQNKQEIVIQLSKIKLTFFVSISLLFIALGTFFLFLSTQLQDSLTVNFLRAGGIGIIIFFTIGGIYFLIKLFDNKVGLIVKEKGIWDNSSSVLGERFIAWKNITGFTTFEIQGTLLLIIKINNAEEVISSYSPAKQKMLRYNLKNYGSPIFLSAYPLKCNFQFLENLLVKSFEQYQSQAD